MRLLAWLLSVVLCFSTTLQAWADPSLPSGTQPLLRPEVSEIRRLIDQGIEQNHDQIGILSEALSDAEREMVYTRAQKEVLGPMIMNTMFGFGIGSFVTGDTVTGSIALLGDLVGMGFIFGNLSVLLSGPDVLPPGMAEGRLPNSRLLIVGICIYGLSRIYALFAPLIMVPAYNLKLKETLGVEHVEIMPFLTGSNIGVRMTF